MRVDGKAIYRQLDKLRCASVIQANLITFGLQHFSAVNAPIKFILDRVEQRDNVNRERESEWLSRLNSAKRGEKPERPDNLVIQILCDDMTNAAF